MKEGRIWACGGRRTYFAVLWTGIWNADFIRGRKRHNNRNSTWKKYSTKIVKKSTF